MAQSDVCVSVEKVSKKFARSLKRSFVYGARDIGRALLARGESDELRSSEFWAVRGVSFELRRGHSIGIVGLNGSGKTTLLRMVSGILKPTLGRIQVHGRIAPMLALGAGFKPVLSGRENIYLNLSLLGVAERDIRARYDSIVDFAELSESINAPIGTYSSGMLARLGFACAVHTDPSILIVDEVLSVGDAKFRVKCRNRMNEMRRAGTSMLLVSHSSILIETLSDECLFMRRGKAMMLGNPREVLKAYEEDGLQQAVGRNAVKSIALAERELALDTTLGIRAVTICTKGANDAGYWLCGHPGEIVVSLQCAKLVEDVSVNLIISDLTHQPGETVLFMMSSRDLGWLRLAPGNDEVHLLLPQVGLRPGTYRIKISVSQGGMHDILDVADDIRLVVRDAGLATNCLYYQSRDWAVKGGEVSGVQQISDEADFEDSEEF